MRLRATVHTFWMHDWNSIGAEDWSALWAMVRAECDIAPVQDATRRTATQQEQSRVRKVATLARAGEKGRALAAARNAPPVPVTEQIVQEIESLYPTGPEPPSLAQALVSDLFLSEVAEFIPTTPQNAPTQRTWTARHACRALVSLAGSSNLFVQVIAHIAAASGPHSVLQYLQAGLAKPTGGHRPLLMMSFLRRLALKISSGSKEVISGQMCGTFAVWRWTTRRSKHDDQNHSVPRGG